MSDFTKVYDITVPAGNAVQALQDTPLNLGLCVVERFFVTFPPGCVGLVGVSIFAGGSPAYPNQQGGFFAFDGYTYEQDVSNQINSGQWDIVAYNLDYLDHTIQVIAQADYTSNLLGTSMSSVVSV